ncbi:MAG: ATP-binding cassette domain-containing protein [Synechococcus sp.]
MEKVGSRSGLNGHQTATGLLNAIAVKGLSKRYGQFVAVAGLDFAVRPGEIFGLIGPDGAGKTTTFQILAGVMEATAGEVRVLGRVPREARLDIGYMTQQFSLYIDLSVDENLRYVAGLRQVAADAFAERRRKYLQLVGLEPFSDRLAGNLSGGMRQKLALCCASISQPQVLLLDEPTTGVDPVSRREFWDMLGALASEGMTIVVATPYLDEAERCHRIALMYGGQIQQLGTLPELRSRLGLERLEVRASDIAAAELVLRTAPPSKLQPGARSAVALADIQSFGDRLDILVEDAAVAQPHIHALLRRHGLKPQSIQTVPPTLENVFVSHLRQQRSEPPYIPFDRQKPGGNRQSDAIAIGAQKLYKTFGSFPAVKGIDLDIRYGEIYGLLGANGAGKTTTIKMLCGLLVPTSGDICLAGERGDLRRQAVRQRIGYMSQKFTLYDDLTIGENLEFYSGVYGIPRRFRKDRIAWVLETCGLVGREHLLTGRLPGGWKQRVAFGAAVMHEPDILFLDEPTSGVDPLARRQFWRSIEDFARQGTAVLVTTHYLEEAEHCQRIGLMVAGAIVAAGSPSEIKGSQPGQMLEVVVDRPLKASTVLKSWMAPWQVSIFGDRLHLVLDNPERDLPPLQAALRSAQLDLHSVRSIPFSLEDAFIGIVQRTEVG